MMMPRIEILWYSSHLYRASGEIIERFSRCLKLNDDVVYWKFHESICLFNVIVKRVHESPSLALAAFEINIKYDWCEWIAQLTANDFKVMWDNCYDDKEMKLFLQLLYAGKLITWFVICHATITGSKWRCSSTIALMWCDFSRSFSRLSLKLSERVIYGDDDDIRVIKTFPQITHSARHVE